MPETPDVDHQHCWHLNFAGVVLDMEPPLIGYRCCHCGTFTHMSDDERAAVARNPAPHGPYIPERPC